MAKEMTAHKARALLVERLVIEAAKKMMQEGYGAKWFADQQGYGHTTLLDKYNPDQEKALHTETLWETLCLGDPTGPLNVLCRAFGGV